jgi:hypothetical protein
MESIENKNDNFQWHGYQQWYWTKGKLHYRGCWKNGVRLGYMEWHNNVCKSVKFYII